MFSSMIYIALWMAVCAKYCMGQLLTWNSDFRGKRDAEAETNGTANSTTTGQDLFEDASSRWYISLSLTLSVVTTLVFTVIYCCLRVKKNKNVKNMRMGIISSPNQVSNSWDDMPGHDPKCMESHQEQSFSLSFSEAGDVSEKAMASNDQTPAVSYIDIESVFSANNKRKHANIETVVMSGKEETNISVLKRSCSNVECSQLSKKLVRSHTLQRTPAARKVSRLVVGQEKKECIKDLQLAPFIENFSKRQTAYTKVEISMKSRSRMRKNSTRIPNTLGCSAQTDRFALNSDINQHAEVHLLGTCFKSTPCLNKDVKIDNCNRNSCETTQTIEMPNDIHQTSTQTECFNGNGGVWIVPNSEVKLTIPQGAVPANQTVQVKREVITDLSAYTQHLQQDERFIAPIAQFECEHRFLKHVRIDIPHCLKHLENIHVQCGDTKKGTPFIDVPSMPKENNIVTDVYHTVGPVYISVYTRHFTQFLCSKRNVPDRDVQLEALLYGKQTIVTDEQEVHLKLFVVDRLYQITDMKQALVNEENFTLIRESSLKKLPDVIHDETEVSVTLSPKGAWALQTKADGNAVYELHQKFLVKTFLPCHTGQYKPVEVAEFVLVSNNDGGFALCFQGDIQMLVCEKIHRQEKKSGSIWSKIRKHGEKKEVELREYDNSMWVNWSFEEVFKKGHCSMDKVMGKMTPTEETVVEMTSQNFSIQNEDTSTEKMPMFQTDEDVLAHIAAKLQETSIKPLLRKLRLDEADWDHIKNSHGGDLREQKYQMLLQYRQQSGAEFSIERILKHLEEIGLRKMASDIRGKWNSNKTNSQQINTEE